MTSSPRPILAAKSADSRATLPLATATAYSACWYAANFRSNSGSRRPPLWVPHSRECSTSSRLRSSRLSKTGHDGNGAVRTGLPPRSASPTTLVAIAHPFMSDSHKPRSPEAQVLFRDAVAGATVLPSHTGEGGSYV